jgi:hypothetical protein
MASEDSRKHLVERAKPRSTFTRWIHLIHPTNDLSETVVPQVLLAFHHLQDLLKARERLPLAAERYDVPLEKRDHALAKNRRRRDLKDQDIRAPRLSRDPPTAEDRLRKLQGCPAALVLIQEESWIDVVAVPARRMPLDAHTERAFTFDKARKEPARCLSASEPFLLIVRITRHVVTMVNVLPDGTR